MKNFLLCCLLATAAIAALASCDRSSAEIESENRTADNTCKTKNITFSMSGDFTSPTFSRAATALQESNMTDIWLIDYMDGKLIQQKHIAKTDADWSAPIMSLCYGTHHIYTIASAGDSPVLSTDAQTITWTKPRDTFYKDCEIDINGNTESIHSVTLDRISTMLYIKMTDLVPADIAKIDIIPSIWYYGVNYVTGEACGSASTAISISIPSSYAGTTGTLNVCFFGIGAADEYKTDASIRANNTADKTIGSATITAAPMQRNRRTEYSGALFHAGGSFSASLHTDWADPYTGNF